MWAEMKYLFASDDCLLCVLFFFLILPGCLSRRYHLFSHEAQGRNVLNSLTLGMGFHCSYVPSVKYPMGGSYSDFTQTSAPIKFRIVEMDNWLNLNKHCLLGLDPWLFRIQGKPMNRWTTLPPSC